MWFWRLDFRDCRNLATVKSNLKNHSVDIREAASIKFCFAVNVVEACLLQSALSCHLPNHNWHSLRSQVVT